MARPSCWGGPGKETGSRAPTSRDEDVRCWCFHPEGARAGRESEEPSPAGGQAAGAGHRRLPDRGGQGGARSLRPAISRPSTSPTTPAGCRTCLRPWPSCRGSQGSGGSAGLGAASQWALLGAALAPRGVVLRGDAPRAATDDELARDLFVPGLNRGGGLAAARRLVGIGSLTGRKNGRPRLGREGERHQRTDAGSPGRWHDRLDQGDS